MRYPIIILGAALMILSAASVFGADVPVTVVINGVRQSFDPPAIMHDGRTYVPLRAGAESIGATVRWDDKTSTATITLGHKRVRIRQNQGITVEGRLLIPLRLMSESLNCDVKWDAQTKAVRISDPRVCPPHG